MLYYTTLYNVDTIYYSNAHILCNHDGSILLGPSMSVCKAKILAEQDYRDISWNWASKTPAYDIIMKVPVTYRIWWHKLSRVNVAAKSRRLNYASNHSSLSQIQNSQLYKCPSGSIFPYNEYTNSNTTTLVLNTDIVSTLQDAYCTYRWKRASLWNILSPDHIKNASNEFFG